MAEKQETKVVFTPENADNKEHRVTASDNSLVDIAPKESGSVEVTEKGKVGSTHLEAETILDYANENLLKGTDENWALQSWSGWVAGYMTYTLEELGVQVGDTVTYSMEIDNTLDYENNVQMRVRANFYDSNQHIINVINGNYIDTGYKGFSSGTKTIPEGTVKIQAYKAYKANSGEGKIAKTRHQKLERGSEATPYTKAQSEVEDDPRIKRDSIPVNIKGERTTDFEGKISGSEEENANKAEIDVRDFENRNLLKDTSDVWDTRTWSGYSTAQKGRNYISELGLSPGDTITFSGEIDNTLDGENNLKVRLAVASYDKNGDRIEYKRSPYVEPGKVGISKQVYTLPENIYYFYLYRLSASGPATEGYTAAFRKTKIEQGDTYTGWSPSAHDLGIPYGQPNLVNHSNYDSRELSEGITELVNDSFLEDTEAKAGDSISSRIRGNLSGYYDGDVLLQGYTKSGANTGEIARKKVNPKTPDQEIWLEEGEIPKDTERLGLYFNRDTDYSMSERNLLLKSGEPQSFKGNGQTNQTMGVSYDLTPDLNESYGGKNFSFQTDIDVIGYDFGGTLYVQTRPNKYVTLFEENLRFENHENKLRNPGMDEPFPEGSNLISSLDMYDYDLGPNQTDKVNYYENNKIDWDFTKSDRNPGVRVQNTDVLKNNQDYTLSFDLEVQEGELDRIGGHTTDFSDGYGYYSIDGEEFRENLLPESDVTLGASEKWKVNELNYWSADRFYHSLDELGLKVGDTITAQAEIDNSLDDKDQTACVDLRMLDENQEIIGDRLLANQIPNGKIGLSWVRGTIPEGTAFIRSYIHRSSNEGILKVAYRRRKLSLGDKVRGIDINDRNLLTGTSDEWKIYTWHKSYGSEYSRYEIDELGLQPGDQIVFSKELDNRLDDTEIPVGVTIQFRDKNDKIIGAIYTNKIKSGQCGAVEGKGKIIKGTKEIVVFKATKGDDVNKKKAAGRRDKLQKGAYATDWTPAPEDIVEESRKYIDPGYGSWSAPAPLPVKENLVQNSNLAEDTDYWEGWTSSEVEASNFTRVPLVEESKFPEYAFKIHKEEGPNGKMGVTQKGSDMGLENNTQYLFKALVRVSDDSPVDIIRAVIEANYGQAEGSSEGYENKHFDVTKEWEPIQLLADSKEGVLYRVGITNEYYGDLLIKDMVVEPVKRSYHVEAHVKSNDKAMDNRGFFIQPNRTPKKSEKPASKGELTNIQLEEGNESSKFSINVIESVNDWGTWGEKNTYPEDYIKRVKVPNPEDESEEIWGFELSKENGNQNLGLSQHTIAVDQEGIYALTAWVRVSPEYEKDKVEARITVSDGSESTIKEVGKSWERIALIFTNDTRSATQAYLGINKSKNGSLQYTKPKFERAEEHHRIEHMKPMSEEALKEIDAINTRADNLPSSLEVTLSNSKWELGDSISPYSQAPEDLDDPGQYSKLEDVEIQVIKGPREAQDDWKPSYVDFYQKTMLQSQARTAIGTLPNLPSLENYTPFKAPKKSLPSSLTYSSVPKFDPKVELPQGHYDKLNTDGESIKAKTKLVGQNAEFTLIFDTVRFTEEAFPELFEGTTNMKEKRERYHEIATFQEVFVTARGNNGVEDKVHVKFKKHLGSTWEENSSSSSSSSLSEISRGLRKGSSFWDGRWVGAKGKTKVLVSTEDTQEFTEKELEVQSARLEVTIQPPENPNATPKTITVLPE